MISQIMSDEESLQFQRQPDNTFRINEENIDGNIDGIESVKQSVRHILSTERYSNPIYDDNYGCELDQYIGKDIGFIMADIETTLSESLKQDDRITNIKVEKVEQTSINSCLISFIVYTIYGNIQEEINVIQ